MLDDKKMFKIPHKEKGMAISWLTIYSMPGTIIMTFFTSYIFELYGRKIVLFLSFFLSGVVYIFFPYCAPNFSYLVLCRCALGLTMAAPMAHPLIPDYIKRSSRGKAVALCGVGNVMGEVFSMGVLFNLTKSMNFYDAFKIAAFLIFMFSAYLGVFVKDPKVVADRGNIGGRHVERAMVRSKRSQSIVGPQKA